MVKII